MTGKPSGYVRRKRAKRACANCGCTDVVAAIRCGGVELACMGCRWAHRPERPWWWWIHSHGYFDRHTGLVRAGEPEHGPLRVGQTDAWYGR